MKAYKGFDKDLKCRDYQYEVGGEYHEDKADLCHYGFHACENPLDCLGYYAPANSRYAEVALDDVRAETSNDSKRVGKTIKVKAEIGLSGIIKAGVEYIMSKVDFDNAKESNTGDQSAATNTGDRSAATNTGDQSAATNTGNQSAATNTGDWSAATNTGNQSAATNTGYWSAATVEGTESVAIATGYESKAKGALGCYIVLAERDEYGHILAVKSHKVDGKTIKADTFYTLKNGEFVEAE